MAMGQGNGLKRTLIFFLICSNGRAKLCDFGFARNLGVHTLVLTSIKVEARAQTIGLTSIKVRKVEHRP